MNPDTVRAEEAPAKPEPSRSPWTRRTWPLRWIAAELAFGLGLTAAGAFGCVAEDREGLPCLGALAPLFRAVVAVGHALKPFGIPPALVPALSLAAALVTVALAWRRRAAASERSEDDWPIAWEAGALALITLTTVLFRFYLLNLIPNDTIADVWFAMVASSDWHSLFGANIFGGAPLGLVHHLLMAGLWRVFGASYLAMRFASALTSVLLVQSVYALTRALAGPLAAVIAAALYAASPVETVWGRHDMFPFSASPLVVLLGLATYFALTRFSLRYWTACALLMGASYHLFASGISAFLIPIGAVVWVGLFDRPRLRRCGARLGFLVVGLGLWLCGRSFAVYLATGRWEWLGPFDPRLSSRVARGEEMWSGFADNLREIAVQIFAGGPGDAHQTPISIFGAPRAWLTPLVAVLFSAGLARCFVRRSDRSDPATPVLLAMLAAGVVPGVVSIAAAHRMSVAFPAMTAIAALAGAAGLSWLADNYGELGRRARIALPLIVLPAAFLTVGSVYFSQRAAEPPSASMAKAMRPFLPPGTLAVLDMPLGLQIDANFFLFDDMLRDRIAITWIDPEHLREQVDRPRPDYTSSYYRESALRDQLPELRARHWTHVVYFVHEASDHDAGIALLRSTFPGAKVSEVVPHTWRPGYRFTVVEVDLDGSARPR